MRSYGGNHSISATKVYSIYWTLTKPQLISITDLLNQRNLMAMLRKMSPHTGNVKNIQNLGDLDCITSKFYTMSYIINSLFCSIKCIAREKSITLTNSLGLYCGRGFDCQMKKKLCKLSKLHVCPIAMHKLCNTLPIEGALMSIIIQINLNCLVLFL